MQTGGKARSLSERLAWAVLAAVALQTILAYLPSLAGEFQFDDYDFVEADPGAKDPERVFRERLLQGLLRGSRPVTELTLALDHAAGGMEPRQYHTTNLGFHLAATVLVFLLASATFRRAGLLSPELLGAVTAALHALHPIQTEAVSYVTQRAEVLASVFYVAVVLLLTSAEQRAGRPSAWAAIAGAFVALVLGLGTKSVIVTAPAAWLLWSHAFDPSREKLRRRLLLASPLLGVAALHAMVVLRSTAGDQSAGIDIPGLPPWRYALTQLEVIPAYLRLLAWPAGQSVDHVFPLSTWPPAGRTILFGIVLSGALASAAWVLLRASSSGSRAVNGMTSPAGRVMAFGILWFLMVIAPTSSVIPLRDVMVEHRLYLASFGPFAGVVAAGARAALHWRARLIAFAAAAAVVIALGVATFQRNEAWKTKVALWSDVVAQYPGNWRGHANLGHAYDSSGDPGRAVEEYRIALRSGPPELDLDVLRSLAGALRDLGRCDEARQVLDRAIPRSPVDPELQIHLAVCLAAAGEADRAEGAARLAVAYGQGRADAHNVLAHVLLLQGNASGALLELEIARRLAPDYPPPLYNTVLARVRLGDPAGACSALREYRSLELTAAEQADAMQRFRGLGCR